MSINDILVDDCLLRLFKEFPLQEQCRLRAVCPHWKNLIEVNIFPTVRSLKLLGSKLAIREYTRTVVSFSSADLKRLKLRKGPAFNDDLIVDGSYCTEAFCRKLAEWFPNVHQLTVLFDGDSPFRDLPVLLELLPGLTHLSLLGMIRYDPIKDFFLLRLCKAINQMTRLVQLDLLPVNLIRSEHAIQVLINRLPAILPQLNGLSIKLFGYRGNISPILSQLGPACKKLHLESLRFFDTDDLIEMLSENATLKSSIEELRVTSVERSFLQFICEYFGNLKYLSVAFSGSPRFEEILYPELNFLTNLTELRLENICLEMSIKPSELTPLPSIQAVTLTNLDLGEWNFDDHCFLSILTTAFPSVERMVLRCVNSIDEAEMFGAFEFVDRYFRHLKTSCVRLERQMSGQLAGRHAED